MSKKIAIYFKKKTGGKDPFSTWGNKRATYHALFRTGCLRGYEMYFIPNPEHYVGGVTFRDPYRYNPIAGEFFQTYGTIDVDAIYDRSGGLQFPNNDISEKTLNPREFKKLCADKNLTYEIIGKFMPKTFRVHDQNELSSLLETFSENETIVLKPTDGFGGKGIVIGTRSEIKSCSQLEPGQEYCLQEFVDTSDGINDITDGLHDLRIIVANGKSVIAHVRTPKKGSLLANVAQGGSMREIPLSIIPKTISTVVEKIQAIINEKYDNPIYSIDFGIDHGKPYVFELNDQIGFPTEKMEYSQFINGIIDSLAVRASK